MTYRPQIVLRGKELYRRPQVILFGLFTVVVKLFVCLALIFFYIPVVREVSIQTALVALAGRKLIQYEQTGAHSHPFPLRLYIIRNWVETEK